MFQFTGFASHGYVFTMRYRLSAVGFPIRKSTDQSLLATPRGLSQRATSFIASQCQGIHQTPLLRLIRDYRHAQGQAQRTTARISIFGPQIVRASARPIHNDKEHRPRAIEARCHPGAT